MSKEQKEPFRIEYWRKRKKANTHKVIDLSYSKGGITKKDFVFINKKKQFILERMNLVLEKEGLMVDDIFVMRQVLEMRREYRETVIAFIDQQ